MEDDKAYTTKQVANLAVEDQIGTVPAAGAVLVGIGGYILGSAIMPPAFAFMFPLGAAYWLFKREPSDADLYRIEGGDPAAAFKYLTPAHRVQIQHRGIESPALPSSISLEKTHEPNQNSQLCQAGNQHEAGQSLAVTERNSDVVGSGNDYRQNRKHDQRKSAGSTDQFSDVAIGTHTQEHSQRTLGLQYRPGGFTSAPAPIDPLAGKYGKTIASITDMHSPYSKPRHLAILAVTQCGKTTTIGAISYALRERYPDMRFVAVDGKNAPWPPFYESVLYPGYGLDFDPAIVIKQVELVYRELGRRVDNEQKGENSAARILLVLDEWNQTHNVIASRVRKPDAMGEVPTGHITIDDLKKLDEMICGIVLQGLEFGVHLCMVLQETNCTKIGLSDDGRINLHFVALGRGGDHTMIDALLGSTKILKSKPKAEQLQKRFNTVWNDANRHPASPVIVDSRSYTAEALPNFTGKFTLVQTNQRHEQPSTPANPKPAQPIRECNGSDSAVDYPADADSPVQYSDPNPADVSDGLTPSLDSTPDSNILAMFDTKTQDEVHRLFGVARGSSKGSQRIRNLYQKWKQDTAAPITFPPIAGI